MKTIRTLAASIALALGLNLQGDELCSLIKTGDTNLVRKIAEQLAKGKQSNSLDATCAPIHLAVGMRSPIMVRQLLAAKISPNLRDKFGFAALHLAVGNRDLDCLESLLGGGADPGMLTPDNQSALSMAAELGWFEGVKALLKFKAPLEPNEGGNPLAAALAGGHGEIATLLQESGAKEENGILWLIVQKKRGEAIKAIVAAANAGATLATLANHLLIATRVEDLEVMEAVLNLDVDPNHPGNGRLPPAHLAATYNKGRALALLLRRGADPNAKDSDGATPLFYACRTGSLDACKVLVEAKADLNMILKNEGTALYFSAESGNKEICQFLLKRRADINRSGPSGLVPLHAAAQRGHAAILEILLAHQPEVNAKTRKNLTPLHFALQENHRACAELLLKHRADVNAVSKIGTPLNIASMHGDRDTVEALLRLGADPNKRSAGAITPLHSACYNGDLGIVQALLKAGARLTDLPEELLTGAAAFPCEFARSLARGRILDLTTKYELTASDIADDVRLPPEKIEEKAKILELLLEKGAPLETESGIAIPLHFSLLHPDPRMTELVILRGAKLNNLSKEGLTPLVAALRFGRVSAAKLLIEKRADVNLPASDGNTPLHEALKRKDISLVRMLIERKADVNAACQGMTPLNYAAAAGDLESVKLLVDAGANPRAIDSAGFTPFLSAIEKNHFPVVEYLLDKSDMRAVTHEGAGPIHVATSENAPELMRFLLKHGLDVNQPNKLGNTPLVLAAANGHSALVEFLLSAGADPSIRSGGGTAFHAAAFGLTVNQQGLDNLGPIPKGYVRLRETQDPESFHKTMALLAPVTPPEARGKGLASVLHTAAAYAKPAVIKVLLEKTPKVDLSDAEGATPLFRAATAGADLETFEALLRRGAAVKQRDARGNTPLHAAAANCGPEVIDLLVTAGADPNAEGERGARPLHWCAQNRRIKVLESLLKAGANPRAADDNGATPLAIAALSANQENCKLLLPYHEINRAFPPLGNLLTIAAGQGMEDLVAVLIEKGENVNDVSADGITPLFAAIVNHHPDCVKLLLQAGADPRNRGEIRTCKPAASAEVARALAEAGGDLYKPDEQGFATFQSAVDHGYVGTVEFMLKKATNKAELANSKVRDGRSCLHLAAQASFRTNAPAKRSGGFSLFDHGVKGHAPPDYARVTRLLLNAGADPSALYKGRTPAHVAVESNHHAVLELLVEAGTPLHAADPNGDTALHRALLTSNLTATRMLLDAGANPRIENLNGITPWAIALGKSDKRFFRLMQPHMLATTEAAP